MYEQMIELHLKHGDIDFPEAHSLLCDYASLARKKGNDDEADRIMFEFLPRLSLGLMKKDVIEGAIRAGSKTYKCSKCKEEKHETFFYESSRGIDCYCKACRKIYNDKSRFNKKGVKDAK